MSEVSFSTSDYVDGILKLLTLSFPHEKKYSKKYIDWPYLRNPYGVTLRANLTEGENVNATYAVFPMKYNFEGQLIDAALSLNTATHPNSRGQSWFPKLANHVYDSAAAQGIKIILGVANKNSIGGFRKHLGFDVLGNVSLRLARPRSHLKALNALRACRPASSDYLKWRLANSSIKYSKLVYGTDSLLVATRSIPFVIGASTEGKVSLPVNRLLQVSPVCPCYYIFSNRAYGIEVPQKLMPSPWHLIIKNLGLAAC